MRRIPRRPDGAALPRNAGRVAARWRVGAGSGPGLGGGVGGGGFSLIELMVVIGIVAILIAIGYPRLATLSKHYRVDSATWNLTTQLQKIRLRAIAEGTKFKVTIDPTARTYLVQKEVSGAYVDDGVAQRIDSSSSIPVSADAAPVFTPRGTVETTATITIDPIPGVNRRIFVQRVGRVYAQ
jgi:prepilin-type N-terminal cleavage/methylation domain-containing protein